MPGYRPNCTAAGILHRIKSVAHYFCTPSRRASRTPAPQVAPLARPSVSAAPGSLSECFDMHQTRRFGRFTRLALLASPAARRSRPPGSQTHQEAILDACSAAMPPPALAAATAAATAAAAAAAAALPRASLPAAPGPPPLCLTRAHCPLVLPDRNPQRPSRRPPAAWRPRGRQRAPARGPASPRNRSGQPWSAARTRTRSRMCRAKCE